MYSPAHPRGLHTTCEVTMSILEIIREFVTRVVELLKDQKRWRRRSMKKAKEDQRHAKPNTVVVVERQMRMREFAAPVNRVQNVPQLNRAVVRPQSTDPPKYPGEEVQQQQRIIRRRIMVVSNPDPMESDSETDTAPKRREGRNDDDHVSTPVACSQLCGPLLSCC